MKQRTLHSLDVAKVTDYVQNYTATLLSLCFCKHQTIKLMHEKDD